ncbi:helix-turn-helix domain-containing protein [Streptomyces sp. NPDC050485]|uniref:helix-turn-helix domain-containing protein n=1 Tax=Streptomyces sp. NPDC050485 TaxID=3365617 RepID=UPI00379630DF
MSDQTDAPAGTQEQLFVEMRRIKQASGFSYGQLADRTHYSRSSWERFLNGKQLPSKVAVEQFAAAAGADPHPLLALLAPVGQTQLPAQEPGAEVGYAPEPGTPEPAAETSMALEPVPPAAEPHVAARRVRERAHPMLARRRLAGRPSWRRRLAAVGCIASGAVMGAVATVLVMGTGAGSHGESGSTPGAQASGAGTGQGMPVSVAGKVDARCSGDTCLRRDPQAMDCQWDASTAHDTWLRGMHIELRYSPACHAVWGRIENGAVGDVVKIRDRTGLEQEATIRTDRDTYTRMLAVTVDAPADSVTICGAIPSQKQMECSPSDNVQP